MFEFWLILTLISAILFAFRDILTKRLFLKFNKFTSKDLLLVEFIYMAILIFIFFSSLIDYLVIFNSGYLILFKAISVISALTLFLNLMKKFEISFVSPLINLSPLFLLFLSFFILKESLSLKELIGVLILILGVFFLEIVSREHNTKFKYILAKLDYKKWGQIILMLILFSFSSFFDKMIANHGINSSTNLFFTSIFGVLILLGIFIYNNELNRIKLLILNKDLIIIASIINLSNYLVVEAITIPTSKIILIVPIRRLSSLFSVFFGGMIFQEKKICLKTGIVTLMLFGVFLIVL